MRYLSVMLVGTLLAGVVAVGVSTVTPSTAQASGGGYAKRCGGGRIHLNAQEKRLFAMHNRVRRNRGLRPFCVHPALQRAASAHSRDMIQRDYFSHNTRGRREGPCERMRRYGYRWRFCGENIGFNRTPERMFRAWMHSPDHHRNILAGKFHEIGVGASPGSYNGPRTTMYTVDFGNRR